jgi:hypothetical protein
MRSLQVPRRVHDFIYKIVAPAVAKMTDDQSRNICLAVKNLILSFDGAHDSVVEARHTRGIFMLLNAGEYTKFSSCGRYWHL